MSVVCCADIDLSSLRGLLQKFSIELELVRPTDKIPGSWFGEPEAGIIHNTLYVRPDTPVHSALHESCHYICMSDDRRQALHTNAGGDYDEENAVCYLSILLSDHLAAFDRQRMFLDMDAWGYTFRLGSSRAWFEEDAADAEQWLLEQQLIKPDHTPCWRVRK
jgi:hypothetical protein